MTPERNRKPRPALDKEGLERLALFYAGRFATSRAKLGAYLARKIKERGWDEDSSHSSSGEIERLVERFTELGYVDDRAFASAKAAALTRRGYGTRRIEQALRAAGIGEEDGAPAREESERAGFSAALRFAQRKRIGPYAVLAPDRAERQKAFAAMLRAGHSLDLVRKILDSPPGDVPDLDLA
ncbi:MAG: RecX family transcriptional regulator [Alphaproteobacteria bacterium]|nr:RecX family transcriptional regulator [Alphaproteobacteria bacterium]